MPTHKQAAKRMRQDAKRRLRNRSVKSRIKTYIKKLNEEIEKKDIDGAKEVYRTVSSLLDKAAKKGVLHPNTSSRKKSRIARKINALEQTQS
jgi:small subunit ribosomal protein S20